MRIMKEDKSTMRKTIGWAAVAVGAFTAISALAPLCLNGSGPGAGKFSK